MDTFGKGLIHQALHLRSDMWYQILIGRVPVTTRMYIDDGSIEIQCNHLDIHYDPVPKERTKTNNNGTGTFCQVETEALVLVTKAKANERSPQKKV